MAAGSGGAPASFTDVCGWSVSVAARRRDNPARRRRAARYGRALLRPKCKSRSASVISERVMLASSSASASRA
jgi:hypothetical protein